MKIILEKLNIINKLIWIVIILTVAFNIIFLMRYNFEADSAFYITLAQEQIRTGSLFPEGMYYSTSLFFLTPNLVIIPFLYLTDNLVLARQLGILVLWLIVYYLLYRQFVVKNNRNITAFIISSSLFSVLYVDSSLVSIHFYQGAYISFLLFLLMFLFLMKRIIENGACGKGEVISIIALYVLANLGDIRSLLMWGIPGFLAYACYIYCSNDHDLTSAYISL